MTRDDGLGHAAAILGILMRRLNMAYVTATYEELSAQPIQLICDESPEGISIRVHHLPIAPDEIARLQSQANETGEAITETCDVFRD